MVRDGPHALVVTDGMIGCMTVPPLAVMKSPPGMGY